MQNHKERIGSYLYSTTGVRILTFAVYCYMISYIYSYMFPVSFGDDGSWWYVKSISPQY